MSEKRQPWLKWYPTDWRADPALRMCSFAARGLWIDMLGLMHEAEPYGFLLVKGRRPTPQQLSGLIGGNPREIEKLLVELEGAGVFSRDEERAIFSRRMVRDHEKEIKDRDNGKRGGNPKIGKSAPDGLTPKNDDGLTEGDKAQMPEARSQKPEQEESPHSHPAGAQGGVPADPETGLLDLPLVLDRSDEAEAARRWNTLAEKLDLPRIAKLTETRKRSIKARLRDAGGLSGWNIALEKVAASAFCRGENDRAWRADIDWLASERGFTRLMEGKFDRAPSGPGGGGSLAAAFADLGSRVQ